MEGPYTHTRITISTSTIIKIVCVLALLWAAFYLRDIVLVVITSVIIASAIEPITKWLMGKRLPRTVAVLLIYGSAVAAFAGSFYFLLVPLFGDFQTFISALPDYAGSFATIPIVQNASNDLGSSVTGFISNLPISEFVTRLNSSITALSQNAFTTANVVLGGLLNLVLILVISFYLSVQSGGVANFLKIITPASHRKYIVGLWARSEQKIGLWLQGQLLLGVIVGVITYLGLLLIGVQHALLLAFIAGVFELIPLFGPILSSIPAIILAFVGGGVGTAFFVAGFYLIVQQFESQLIYPLVVKKVIGVPPIISILALVIGAKLAGFLGLLIAVPVVTIFMEFFHDIERERIGEEERDSK